MSMSNEADILVVGNNSERFTVQIRRTFRHWQVYTLDAPGALYGRRFRRAYYTDGAEVHKNWERMWDFLRNQGEVRHLSTFSSKVDPQDYEDAELLRAIRRSRHSQDWV